MPSPADRALIVNEFESSIWPKGHPTLDDAWLGIMQVLLWYWEDYPHVIEANELENNATWRRRAKDAEALIASELGIPPADVRDVVDRMMRLPRWQKKSGKQMQRNNPLGHGFRTLVAHALMTWGNTTLTYFQEAPAMTAFPGITLAGSER